MTRPPARPPPTPADGARPGRAARHTPDRGRRITSPGANGSLIAAAFAVPDAGGDGGDVGLVAAARTLPLVLFLLIGGTVADRLPTHRVRSPPTPSTAASPATARTGPPPGVWRRPRPAPARWPAPCLMTRWKPPRLLLAGTLCVFPLSLPSAALAVPVPVGVLYAVMFVAGRTVEVFGVSWTTALHQEVPEDELSRVSACDWFGSVSLLPLATALAGPAESAFGRTPTL